MLASDGIETCNKSDLLEIVYSCSGMAADITRSIISAVEAHEYEYQDNATIIACKYLD